MQKWREAERLFTFASLTMPKWNSIIRNACAEGKSFTGNDELDKARTEMSALSGSFILRALRFFTIREGRKNGSFKWKSQITVL